MRAFRAGYREVDGRTFAVIMDWRTGVEISREDVTDQLAEQAKVFEGLKASCIIETEAYIEP